MKKNAILFSASNYTKSPLIQINNLPGVKYDIQAMHKRLTQIGFEVKQIENISKDQIIPALEDNASHSPCDAIHIVYFTGHGGHNNGNNYIYPVDFASEFEKSKDIETSAMNIQDIISIYKGKGRLILILDACRSDFGLSKGYYSEITAAEDVYIAYGTQFQYTSIGIANQMSPFTQAICDEILEPNIDVDELFTRVRRNVYSKYQIQIPASVNALLNRIVLHKQLSYTNFDEEVYKFVKKYADDYNNKYGYFHGDDLIFIDAAQYFNISFLDAVWKFRKVDNKVYTDRVQKSLSFQKMKQNLSPFTDYSVTKNILHVMKIILGIIMDAKSVWEKSHHYQQVCNPKLLKLEKNYMSPLTFKNMTILS